MYIVQKIVKELLNDNSTKLSVCKSIELFNTKTCLNMYLEDVIEEIKSTLENQTPYNLGQLNSANERMTEWLNNPTDDFELNKFSDINIVVSKIVVENGVIKNKNNHELFDFDFLENYIKTKFSRAEYYVKFFCYGLSQSEFVDVNIHKRRFSNPDENYCVWNTKQHNENMLSILRSLLNNYLIRDFVYKDVDGNDVVLKDVVEYEGTRLAICINKLDDKIVLIKPIELNWTQSGIF